MDENHSARNEGGHDGPQEGYPKLKMKGRNGGRLGLETAYEMTPKLALTGTLAWQQWEFGASPIREVGDSLAPTSNH